MPDPRMYRYGARGEHVRNLQISLNNAGYDLATDGILGPRTIEAVLEWEADHCHYDSFSYVIDRRSLEDILVPPVPPPWTPDPRLPAGKGVAIRSLSKRHLQSPDEFRTRLSECGIRWVQVQRVWQRVPPEQDSFYNGDDATIAPYLEVLRELDVKIWVTGWPVPGRHEEFFEVMLEYQRRLGAVGIISNPEAPWFGFAEEAEAFTEYALSLDVTQGMTSYGGPWNFPTFPLRQFSRLHFAGPQIYDLNNMGDPDYPQRSVDAYLEAGFERVIPTSPLFGKTQGQLEDLLDLTPMPERAVKFWDWYNAHAGQPGWKWDVVRALDVDQPVGQRFDGDAPF